MKTRLEIGMVIMLVVGAACFLWMRGGEMKNLRSSAETGAIRNPRKSPQEAGDAANSAARSFLAAYRTPIEFYGKVVDQHGNPVAGATIRLLPVDSLGEDSRTKRTLSSDAEGKFSVKGLKGLAMGVQVTKDGYLTLTDLGFDRPASSRMIEYGLSNDGGNRFKDPSNPTLFTLHEVGPIEPMVYVERKRWRLPVDGSPVRIALDSQDGSGTHWIEFRFQSGWNQLPMDNEINSKKFDWRLDMRIPGGGFLNNDSDYNFEPPEDGYEENLVIEYPASMPRESWRQTTHRRLFVKFADDTYGRIRFMIDGSSDRKPLYMTSWMSLKPGSGNLASPHKDGFLMPEDR